MKTNNGPKYFLNVTNPEKGQPYRIRVDREVRIFALVNKLSIRVLGNMMTGPVKITAVFPDGTEERLWRIALKVMVPDLEPSIKGVGITDFTDCRVENLAIVEQK